MTSEFWIGVGLFALGLGVAFAVFSWAVVKFVDAFDIFGSDDRE